MKTFVALFALVAAVAAESDPQFWGTGYHGYPHAAALPYHAAAPAVPQVEQPSGFYYHVQTYDKVPAAPQLNAVPAVPSVPMATAAATAWPYNYNYNNWAAAGVAPYWNNGAYANWAAHPYAHAAWNPYYYNHGLPMITMEQQEMPEQE